MNDQTAPKNQIVVSADDVLVGRVDGVTETHINVRTPMGDSPTRQLWIPCSMIASADADTICLSVERAELHEAVYCMSPGQQREYATLGLGVRIGRERGLT